MNKHAIYCSDIEDEQMLKDWLKKEFSDTYYQRDYLFHNKLYFHFPALDNDLKDNFVIGYHTDENIRKDYTKINIKDFLKEYYMKELPNEWFIKVTEDNFDIIDKWLYRFKGYHPTPPRCVNYDGTWSIIENSAIHKYIEITTEQFKEYVLKENMKTELLGLPIIKGEQHHLEAFAEDCKKIGYVFSDISYISDTSKAIVPNVSPSGKTNKPKDLIRLCAIDSTTYYTGFADVKEFQLPQDWSKALDFMKDHMDRWNKIQEENKEPEFKVGDVVVVTEQYKDNSAKPGLITKLTKISNSDNAPYEVECSWNYGNTTWCLNVRKATPQEIEEYNNKPKIFKMTSSSGDFELEVSKKGIYYRPEDKWLSTDNIAIMLDCLRGNGRVNHENIKGHYTWKVESITVGCKSNVPVESWKEVYNYYKSLQK